MQDDVTARMWIGAARQTVRRARELYSGLHVLLLDGQMLGVTGLGS